MDKKEIIENLKSGTVLKYSCNRGGKGYFFVSEVRYGRVYGSVVTPFDIQGSISLESLLNSKDLEIADKWKEFK